MDGSDDIVLSEEEGSWLGEYLCEMELEACFYLSVSEVLFVVAAKRHPEKMLNHTPARPQPDPQSQKFATPTFKGPKSYC